MVNRYIKTFNIINHLVNANQTYIEILLIPVKMAIIKKANNTMYAHVNKWIKKKRKQITNVAEDAEKKETFHQPKMVARVGN
jgi:hypothetical protein